MNDNNIIIFSVVDPSDDLFTVLCVVFVLFSEATQCITLYSRQGTTDTIEEVEDEQDQGEDRQHGPRGPSQPDGGQGAEDSPWEAGEPGEEGEGQRDQDGQKKDPWDSFGPGEGPSYRAEQAESAPSAHDKDYTTESDEGGSRQEYLHSDGRVGQLYTPDTDASKTSDAEVPPSYSKAVSFDRLEVSDDESDLDGKRLMVMTPDSRSDSRSELLLPSMTTELTASELLLNK